jgi:hypothetical protein
VLKAVSCNSRLIRIPLHMHTELSRLRKCSRAFTVANGRAPSQPELAAEAGLSTERLKWTLDVTRHALSVDVGSRAGSTIGSAAGGGNMGGGSFFSGSGPRFGGGDGLVRSTWNGHATLSNVNVLADTLVQPGPTPQDQVRREARVI